MDFISKMIDQMHQIEIEYKGELRTCAVHLQSGESIITDAPTDNEGKGEAFSPTDLVATSLGSCMLTIMGIVAKQMEINIRGTRSKVTKIMGDKPRKITKIIIHIYFPFNLCKEHQAILKKSALSCPVHQSLHADVEKDIIFHNPSK